VEDSNLDMKSAGIGAGPLRCRGIDLASPDFYCGKMQAVDHQFGKYRSTAGAGLTAPVPYNANEIVVVTQIQPT
jgi:hypothetical protein